MRNAGSKQWRDVKLVHKEGHVPVTHQVVLPDLQPGEETQVTVNYTAIGMEVPENKLITRYIMTVCYIREFCRESVKGYYYGFMQPSSILKNLKYFSF